MCDQARLRIAGKSKSSSSFSAYLLEKLYSKLIVCLSLVVALPTVGHAASDLPLFSVDSMEYIGAFKIPQGTYGESSIDYSEGHIAYNPENKSMYIVGQPNHQSIGEFPIPDLVNSTDISKLNEAGSPIQGFSRVLNRASTSNTQSIDRIGGMAYVDGELIVNGYEYYDAPADNTHTTLIMRDANNLSGSAVDGYFELDGKAHTSGWISPVPNDWQQVVGGTHISGQCGLAITTRLSVGPPAFSWTPADVPKSQSSGGIPTTKLLDFSLANPLNGDLYNESLDNDIWTHLSRAIYGFIVPGTRTYATFGYSGGHEHGLGYKIEQDTGNVCGGPCSYVAADNYNFYWLWDMNDLEKVKNGELNSYDVRPYAYGAIDVPFGNSGGNKIGGGTFDPETGTLYFSITHGDRSEFSLRPVIIAYNLSGSGSGGSGSGGSGSGGSGSGGSGGGSETPSLAVSPSGFASQLVVSDSSPAVYNPSYSTGTPPSLPTPTGVTTFQVSTATELSNAVSNLQDNSLILISPGVYNLERTLYIGHNNVTIAGTGSKASDVVLTGRGMENANYGDVPHGIWSNSLDLTVTNLTIRDVYFHGIVLNGGAERPHIHNVVLLDTGTQFIKANPVAYGDGVDDGIVEYVRMEYTSAPPSTDHGGGGGTGYTNGVDVHAGNNWIVRNNAFINFHTPDNSDHLTNPAILMWNGARNSLAEGNVFIDVDRAISFGLYDNPSGNDHSGGVIKNNMITYSSGLYSSSRTSNSDGAIIVWDSPNTKVLHNTILTNGNVLKAVEFRFDTAGSEARNNLTDAPITARGGSPFVASGNQESASTQLFVDPSVGNLHLKAGTTKAGRLGDVLTDVDGSARSSSTDIGADQF